jgi:hypothetical protein
MAREIQGERSAYVHATSFASTKITLGISVRCVIVPPQIRKQPRLTHCYGMCTPEMVCAHWNGMCTLKCTLCTGMCTLQTRAHAWAIVGQSSISCAYSWPAVVSLCSEPSVQTLCSFTNWRVRTMEWRARARAHPHNSITWFSQHGAAHDTPE